MAHRGVLIPKLVLIALMAALAQGCVISGYTRFYEHRVIKEFPRVSDVKVYKFTEEILGKLQDEGFRIIGSSSFNGPLESRSAAIKQARKAGADVVVLDFVYTGAIEEIVPVTEYYPYYYGGFYRYPYPYYSRPGYAITRYVPYTTHMYDQTAIFLRKARQYTGLPVR